MRMLAVVLALVLVPVALSAQKPQTPGETRMAPKKGPPWIPSDVAANAAVTRVRTELTAGKLNAWGGGQGGGIKPAALAASKTLFNPTGGKDGKGLYVVLVSAAGKSGHVRVLLDPRNGAVLETKIGSWDWGNTPDWWVKGLSSPPPARSN